MAFDGLITAFLGYGATVDRPVTPNVMPGAITLWYANAGALAGQLSMWTGAAWREDIIGDAGITVQNDTSLSGNSTVDPPSVHAAKTYIDVAIAALVNSAPASLNTLKELADAINDDATVYATIVTALAGKAAHDPVVQNVASSANVTPAFGDDMTKITAQAVGLTLANWSGSAIPGWGHVIRIKDNGGAQTIAYGTKYREIGVTKPAATVPGKTLYLACIYNSDDDKIDIVAVAQQA